MATMGYSFFRRFLNMKETTIKALMIEPKKAPCKCTLTNELSELQKAVSIGAENVGLIEIVNLSSDV